MKIYYASTRDVRDHLTVTLVKHFRWKAWLIISCICRNMDRTDTPVTWRYLIYIKIKLYNVYLFETFGICRDFLYYSDYLGCMSFCFRWLSLSRQRIFHVFPYNIKPLLEKNSGLIYTRIKRSRHGTGRVELYDVVIICIIFQTCRYARIYTMSACDF